MIMKDSRAALRWVYSVMIGIVMDNAVKTGTTGGGGCPQISIRADLIYYV